MRDLLAAWASAFLADAALPLLLWTALALSVEAGLGRAHAALSLPVRSAMLAALPTVLVAGPLGRWLTPLAAVPAFPVGRFREAVLPEVVVGLPASVPSGPPDALVWIGAALALAALVGVVALVRLAVACVRLSRLDLPDAPADVQTRAAVALRGVRRDVRVVTGGDVPLTFGVWRPVLVVPDGLAGDALDLALAHEAAHLRAGDFGWHLASCAVAAAFAAHPLALVLVRGQALDRERLADAAVLAARPDARRAYADLLVSFSSRPTPRLALGVGAPLLLHRLTAMTHLPSPRQVRGFRRAGRLVAALTFAAVALAGFATSTQEPGGTRAFEMIRPTTVVNGVTVESGATEIRTDAFRFLEVALLGYGRFIVSDAPFDGAVQAGRFDGRSLDLTVGVETLAITAEAALFAGGTPVPAYARFDAFDGQRLPVGDAALIVGVTQSLDRFGTLDPAEHERAYRAAIAEQEARQMAGEPPAEGVIAWRTTAAGDTVYDAAEQMPAMVGGTNAFANRIDYPEAARADGTEGVTVVRFVVSETGRVGQTEIARSSGDVRLDSAAVRAVRAQPFAPGRHEGRAVAVRMVLPVRWVLPADDQGALPATDAPADLARYADRVDIERLAAAPETQAMFKAMHIRLNQFRARYDEVSG